MCTLTKFEEKLCERIKFLCKLKGQFNNSIANANEAGIQLVLGLKNMSKENQDAFGLKESPLCWPDNKRDAPGPDDKCPEIKVSGQRVTCLSDNEKDEFKNRSQDFIDKRLNGKWNCGDLITKCSIDGYCCYFEKFLYSSFFKESNEEISFHADICFYKSDANEYNYVEIKYPRGNYKWLCQEGCEDKDYEQCVSCLILKKGDDGKSLIFGRCEGDMITDLVRLLNSPSNTNINKFNRYFVAFFKTNEVPDEMLSQLASFIKRTKTASEINALETTGKKEAVHLHEIEKYKKSNIYYFSGDPVECNEFDATQDNPSFDFLVPKNRTNLLNALLIKIKP